MNNRNIRQFTIVFLFIFIVALATAAWRLPAYTSRMPWVFLFLIIDIYLLKRIDSQYRTGSKFARNTWIILNFIPSTLLTVFSLSMLFMTPLDWNPVLRTYWLGITITLYTIRLFPLSGLLIVDLLRFRSYFGISLKPIVRKAIMNVSWGLSVLTSLVLINGMVRVYDVVVTEQKIIIRNLPSAFNGYRIVQISDWHLGRFHSQKAMQSIITRITELEPDVIVFTGDLVNYATAEAMEYRSQLAEFHAPDGMWAVLGNHDYGDYLRWESVEAKEQNIQQMGDLLHASGWTLMRNMNHKISRDSSSIFLAGIDHWSPHTRFPVRFDFDKAMEGIKDQDVVILLAHDPVFWKEKVLSSEYDVDLTLSGHTHGFQVGLSVWEQRFSPAAILKRYWHGLYRQDNAKGHESFLYVNAGLGHIMFPWRIGMKAEITLMTLHAHQ